MLRRNDLCFSQNLIQHGRNSPMDLIENLPGTSESKVIRPDFEEAHCCKCTFQQSASSGFQLGLVAWKRAHGVEGRSISHETQPVNILRSANPLVINLYTHSVVTNVSSPLGERSAENLSAESERPRFVLIIS